MINDDKSIKICLNYHNRHKMYHFIILFIIINYKIKANLEYNHKNKF